MKANLNALMGHLGNSVVARHMLGYKERMELKMLTNDIFPEVHLRYLSHNDLEEIFTDPVNETEWIKSTELIKKLELPEMQGGVNPGDQRAIFYLINAIRPNNVLEIGTHIGCSTVHIALALMKNINSHLTTVDLIDVNDPVIKHWQGFNCKYAPCQLIEMVGALTKVSFVKDNSIHFLKNCRQKFDFVFLDGSHIAKTIFKEIPLVMGVLNDNGVVLLHDYFPHNKPIWQDKPTIPGPYLAIRKIVSKQKDIAVLPLGELPWKTKINSHSTSLAVLTKRH
ncbi:class I SAM-dependent methyltransferase [Flavitalea antarctica]